VHALLGENGAGKSTLMSILYGLYSPDEGEIRVNGEPAEVTSPSRAIDLGIGMVHQHFMLVPVMTVTENIVLGEEPTRGVLLDVREGARRVKELSDRYGLRVDPDAVIEQVSVGMQQRVEILKTLYRDARILILDEPTAVLTAQETQELFEVLNALKEDGVSIVFISHKLNEVLEISDRVTVLRRGEKIDTVQTEGATEESLARLMVGRDVLLRVEKESAKPKEPVLEVEDLHVRDQRGLEAVKGVSMTIRGGEVVAIAGVDGNGQLELVQAIAGVVVPESGSVRIGGEDVTGEGVRDTADAGLAHIPEDRQLCGLVLDFTLAENLALREYRQPPLSNHGLLSLGAMKDRAGELLKEYDVRGGDPGTLASSLSGGNQQKVAVAREIASDPKLLIAHQPTRGLDVGAIEFVHRRLLQEREEGVGILLVSLEFEEIRALADRILVIYEGELVAEFPADVSEEELGVAMTGGRGGRTAA
jgi:simple sugar transport system ATP-binding protein